MGILCLNVQAQESKLGSLEDTSLVKLRNTGYELIYSYSDYNFYEFELLNESILLLLTHEQSGVRFLMLGKNHLPSDTVDVNCWPPHGLFGYRQSPIWKNGSSVFFKPSSLYYTPEICKLDQRKERSQLVLKFETSASKLVNFSCKKIPETDLKKFKKWDTSSHFEHNETTVSWLEKKKKKQYFGELLIGSKTIVRPSREKSYILSHHLLPVNDYLMVLDETNKKIYWAKKGEVVKQLSVPELNENGQSHILYDNVSEKIYLATYETANKQHYVYEVDQNDGTLSPYFKFDHRCYDLSIRNGHLYFIMKMAQIDPEFQTTGLFMKRMITTD